MSHGDARPGDGGHEPLGSVGEEAAKLFDALQEWARDGAGGERHGHATAGGVECTGWCPVCRGAQLVRQTSPEVKAHLTAAAGSLLQAAAGLLAAASLAIGVLSVAPQVIMPIAADLAPAEERGRVVGTVLSGLLIGILMGRVVSGAVGERFGWLPSLHRRETLGYVLQSLPLIIVLILVALMLSLVGLGISRTLAGNSAPPPGLVTGLGLVMGLIVSTLGMRLLAMLPALAIDMGWFTWWPVKPKPSKHQLAQRGPAKIPTPV